jgi:hypothetical protein
MEAGMPTGEVPTEVKKKGWRWDISLKGFRP